VNVRRAARRVARGIVHNWPLKLAAIALATLLYAGLVASQDSSTFTGPIPVLPENQPPDTKVTNTLRDVEQIQYIAPADLGRLRAEDFRATVDLSGVPADGTPTSVRVNVTPSDPRVTILAIRPQTIAVVLDQKVTKQVKVTVVTSSPPDGLQVGATEVTPSSVEVSGASADVNRVVEARVTVTIDASGLNVDRDVTPEAVDDGGEKVNGVDLDPSLVHVTIPVYENLENKTVPVNAIATGTPGAGYRVDRVTVDPLVVSVEGDQDQLATLVTADTAPVSVSGATRDVTGEVAYALPTGVNVIGGPATARVTVHIVAITETRTFTAGLRLDGRQPDLDYAVSDRVVLLTLFGSTADLDRLQSSPIVIALNVADLGPGDTAVPVVPELPSTVSVAAISPETVTVTVTERPTPTPAPTAVPEGVPTEAPPEATESPTAAP
jgi:YbbR domain-containing protein